MRLLAENPSARRPTSLAVLGMILRMLVATSGMVPVAAGQVTLINIGPVSGGAVGDATAVSADGTIVGVAVAYSSNGESHPCRWTEAGGFQDLGTMPGGHHYDVTGISGDGSTVVGWGDVLDNGGIQEEGFRWTAGGGMQAWGMYRSQFNGVNGDGTVVAGMSDSAAPCGIPLYNQGYQWSIAGGTQPVPPCGDQWGDTGAWAVSADGTVLVGTGWAPTPGSYYRAFRWTPTGGTQDLGVLGSGLPGNQFSSALAVSADGATVVGSSGHCASACGECACNGTTAYEHAFRWNAAIGMQDLGVLPGGTLSRALGVSGDGSIVVGYGDVASFQHAFVWTQASGMLDLNTLLPAFGIDLTNDLLSVAHAISYDGTSIVINGSGSPTSCWEVHSVGALWAFPPAVSTVSPNHGPNSGASGVVITGSHFTGTTSVLFGSNPASFTIDSDNQITANFGATSTVGFVDVSVSNGSLTNTLSGAFDYFIPPTTIGAPCGTPSLTWQGSPTLGQTFTLVTQGLAGQSQLMLFDWSNINPRRSLAFPSLLGCTAPPCPRYVRADAVQALGNNSTFNLAIPNDPNLIGVHVRVQALISGCPRLSTQALDAVIGL